MFADRVRLAGLGMELVDNLRLHGDLRVRDVWRTLPKLRISYEPGIALELSFSVRAAEPARSTPVLGISLRGNRMRVI